MQYSLFTSPESFVDEIDLIERLFDCGVDFLYVQKPGMGDVALERFLISLPESIRKKSFLCGSPNKAVEFGLAGFHLPLDWFKKNVSAALRASGLWSVEAESRAELDVLPPEMLEKFSRVVLKSREGKILPSDFVLCDATELSSVVGNRAVASGIWEFADPVAAWRRLCR